jgi:transposase InsO family protein
VIDLATRMVVGWQLAEHMRTSLVTDALTRAVTGGHAPPEVIFHSDKGCQYQCHSVKGRGPRWQSSLRVTRDPDLECDGGRGGVWRQPR